MRTLIAALVLLFASAVSSAADIEPAVQQLDATLAARIAAIAKPSSPESKGLANARKKILRYKGRNDVADFRTLGAVVGLIDASRTRDAAVLADMRAMIETLFDRIERRLGFIEDEVRQMIDPLHVAAVDRAKEIPARLIERARSTIDTDPVRTTALATKGYDLLGLVLLRAGQLVEAEYGRTPPDGLAVVGPIDAPAIENSGTKHYDILKIRVFAVVLSGAAEVRTYAGDDAKTVVPGLFAERRSNRIAAAGAAPTAFPLRDLVLVPLVPGGTQDARITGALWVYVKNQPSFFIVPFDVPVQ